MRRLRVMFVAVGLMMVGSLPLVHAQTSPDVGESPLDGPTQATDLGGVVAADVAEIEAVLRAEAHAAAIASAQLNLAQAESAVQAAQRGSESLAAEVITQGALVDAAASRVEAARQQVALTAVDALIGTGQPTALMASEGGVPDWMAREAVAPVVVEDAQGHFDVLDRELKTKERALKQVTASHETAIATVVAARQLRDELAAHLATLTGLGSSSATPAGPGEVGPAVLGDSVLTAEEMASWFRATRPFSGRHMTEPIVDVARYFLEEGAAEGVRGDIAFAQTIIETGSLSSPRAYRDFNFAGIGAFDSCAAAGCGFRFPTLREGVRAQIQLLRTYATPGLTTDQLANSPHPRLAPERSSVRGCCDRWVELAGTWASDRRYGSKVLGIYSQMLQWALTQRDATADEPR